MKIKMGILFVLFLLSFVFSSTAWAEPEEKIEEEIIEAIIIDESKGTVTVEGFLNSRYFQNPGKYAVVFREGFNAKQALFIAHAAPFELYAALLELEAVPGDNMTLDSHAGVKTEGSYLELSVKWEGTDEEGYILEELVTDSQGNKFDIRFSGNLENLEEVSSGCLVCLDSCPIGITGNAQWGNRAYEHRKVFFKVNRRLLPSNGTRVKIIFKFVNDQDISPEISEK